MVVNSRAQFGEPAWVPGMEAKQCTAVDRDSSKMYFSHLKKILFKYTLYLEYFQRFTLLSDSPFLWHYYFSTVEVQYSYA